MLKEFREFAMKGNVVDLAVGVIIGASFGKIVTSLVSDIIMPPIGLMLGGLDFSHLFINISGKPISSLAEAEQQGVATINYGLFINNVIDFLIVALVIFLVIKQLNRFKREEKAADDTLKQCTYCFSKIDVRATKCPNCTSQVG